MNINIKSILATGECVTLECKKAQNSVPIFLWDTYSAFANTYGGKILLGVAEHTYTKFICIKRPRLHQEVQPQKEDGRQVLRLLIE